MQRTKSDALAARRLDDRSWLAASKQHQQRIQFTKREIANLESEKAVRLQQLRKLETEVESLQTLRTEAFAAFQSKQAVQVTAELDETAMRKWISASVNEPKAEGNSHD